MGAIADCIVLLSRHIWYSRRLDSFTACASAINSRFSRTQLRMPHAAGLIQNSDVNSSDMMMSAE